MLSSASIVNAQQDVVAKHRNKVEGTLNAETSVFVLRAIASDVGGGLLKKTTGNNCLGYSCDIICFADGRHYDVFVDGWDNVDKSGGVASPTWSLVGNIDPSRCEIVTSKPEPEPPAKDTTFVLLMQIIKNQQEQIRLQQEQTEKLNQAVAQLRGEVARGIKIRW